MTQDQIEDLVSGRTVSELEAHASMIRVYTAHRAPVLRARDILGDSLETAHDEFTGIAMSIVKSQAPKMFPQLEHRVMATEIYGYS